MQFRPLLVLWLLCTTLFGSWASQAAGAPERAITVRQAERLVIVETDRYAVALQDGLFVSLKNKLVDEEMSKPTEVDLRDIDNSSYASGVIADLRGKTRRWPGKESQLEISQPTASNADITYIGLFDRSGRRFEGRMTFHLAVDEATGDLLIRLSCKTGDPGISDLVFSFPYLRREVTCLAPIFWGSELVYDDFVEVGGREFRWPSHSLGLRFQMSILKGRRGTCMIWSEDHEVMQGKTLYWSCSAENPGIAFGTENIRVPIEDQTEMETVTWRLNTFGKDWREAADRYKAHLNRAYNLDTIKKSRPQKAKEIRVFARMPPGDPDWFKALQQSKISLNRCVFVQWGMNWFMSKSANIGQRWVMDYPPRHFRVAPDGNQPDLAQRIESLHAIGGRAVVFTPHNLMGKQNKFWSRPEYSDMSFVTRVRRRVHLGALEARTYLREQLKDLFAHLPADGVYIDTAGTTWRFFHSEEKNQFLQERLLYKGMTYDKGTELYFNEELVQAPFMKDKIIFGECANELDFAGIDMAILGSEPWGTQEHKDRRLNRVHPLCSYLTGDGVKLVAHGSAWPNKYRRFHRELDHGEVTGLIPVMYANRPEDISRPLHESKLIMEKAVWFSNKNLTRFFPKDLDESVAAYYRGNDGAEYRFTRDRGRGFVQMTAEGPKTIFHRIHGVAAFGGNGHIDDWACYDGDKAIGLDPDKYYCYFSGPRTNQVNISALPENVCVSETRETEDYLVVRLESAGGAPVNGEATFMAACPLAAVYANGVSAERIPAAGAGARVALKAPGELVFIKNRAPNLPLSDALKVGKRRVHTIMANGFSMRFTNASEDPKDVSRTIDGAVRHGVQINAVRSHYFHEFAKTYIDASGRFSGGSLKVWFQMGKVRAMRKTEENTGNLLRVHLDGNVVFERKLPDAGEGSVAVPLKVAVGGMPHLLSISYEGNPVVIYPEVNAK